MKQTTIIQFAILLLLTAGCQTDDGLVVFESRKFVPGDLIKTIEQLELYSMGNDTRNLLVKVKPGTEEFWTKQFEASIEVAWVDLNWYADIELH
jgi:hypothetical protein